MLANMTAFIEIQWMKKRQSGSEWVEVYIKVDEI
jgi:hypothetical protein